MQRTPPTTDGTTVAKTPIQRSKRQRTNSSPPSPSFNADKQEEIISVLNEVLIEIKEIRKTNTELQKSLDFYMKRCDEMAERIATIERKSDEHEKHIKNLENKLEESERQLRSTCLEMRGIPYKPRETKQDLCSLVEILHKKLKVDMIPNIIKDVYRIKAKPNEERPIVIEFTTSITKMNILQAVKKYNASNITDKLNTNSLEIEGKKSPVFVSEFLTPKAKRLFFLARDVAKTYGFNFCWSSNGKIFLRKAEGMAPIVISNELQLQELKQKN